MTSNDRAMVTASFVADSLALGAHWIYDCKQIEERYGRIERFVSPAPGSFHAGKNAGDFTHYGDQALILLRSLAACGRFDLEDFATRWRDFFRSPTCYVDKATQATLVNMKRGNTPRRSGSFSSDLGGASRIAPLCYLYHHDEDALLESCRAQTAMTHNHPLVLAAACFFAVLTRRVLHGSTPREVIERLVEDSQLDPRIRDLVEKGLTSQAEDSLSAIIRFGQSCDAEAAIPGTVHLIVKFEDDLSSALIENTMAGGDSAARGMLAGMVLGAHLGSRAIPEKWHRALVRRTEIDGLLDRLGGPKGL